jgi:phosphoribosylanthranilate isomerase
MKIKLCGFTELEPLKFAISCGCDFVGFVFYEKSPRYLNIESAKFLFSNIIDDDVQKVSVLVNPSLDFLKQLNDNLDIDFWQFHGDENVEFLEKVKSFFPKIKIIKAFRISCKEDLQNVNQFNFVADLFLFDNKIAGSGNYFDWEILKNFHHQKEWFLSGGLNIDNICQALEVTRAKMLDISSGIEIIKGKKSKELINELMSFLKQNISVQNL